MNEIVEKLARQCKNIASTKVAYDTDIYNEIIELILKENIEEEKKLNLLIELYRYAYYNGVRTSLDPRGDIFFKTSMLSKVKTSLDEEKEVSQNLIKEFKETNDYMREFIDSPVKFIEDEIKFYKENPNTKF